MIHRKQLSICDAESVANLHSKAFKDFFLSVLGVRFLKAFYKALIQNKETICFGYWDSEGSLAGFFVANTTPKGFYKKLCVANFIPFFLSSFPTFLRNPPLLLRLMNSFTSNPKTKSVENMPYLMSICVEPTFQNKGIGKKMIQDLMDILVINGYKGVYLTTDAIGNDTTISFYSSSGFLCKETYSQGTRKMSVFFKDLSKTISEK